MNDAEYGTLLRDTHDVVIENRAHLKSVDEKLERLNGAVAENTEFRIATKASYTIIGIAWASILLPLTAMAVAVWT